VRFLYSVNHEWIGAKSTSGYPRVRYDDGVSAGVRQAHRVFYEYHVGPIGEGLVIDHLCCNAICVNPAHLEPVTHAENSSRGGRARREAKDGTPAANGLTLEIAREIREQAHLPQAEVAERYGITQGQVSNILRGEQWRENGAAA
jgi:DNA-binding transcriptional regulator YiaG